jgi:hypothetical protein
MNEVKVYDGAGNLKKVISRDDLIKRSAGLLNAPPQKKFKNRGRPATIAPAQKTK